MVVNWSARARFVDQIVVLTAAASGIGAATARKLAGEGGRIIAVDTNAAALHSLLHELPGGTERHLALVANCLDEGEVRTAVARALAFAGGRIDVLINGVGGSTLRPLPGDGLDLMPLEQWNELVQFNLNGTFLLCKHVMPVMKAQRAGKIVNLASIAARGDEERIGNGAYSAAKAGVVALTRRVSRELASYGVTCNAVAPGGTLTPRLQQYYATLSPQVQAEALTRIPLGRRATPEDQANAIVFLASCDADFITGVTLDVTGGQ